MYIVTGLTKMNSGICMSVYDTEMKRYLRPIPPSSRFKQTDLNSLELFSIVNLTPDKRMISVYAPHTEDYPIEEQKLMPIRILDRNEQIQFLRKISVKSIHDVFGYNNKYEYFLKQRGFRNYLIPGTGTNSLGTVSVKHIRVYSSYSKIKIDFTDSSGLSLFELPYVSTENIDANQLMTKMKSKSEKYVRLSLARQFKPDTWDFDACFLQVSSIHGY